MDPVRPVPLTPCVATVPEHPLVHDSHPATKNFFRSPADFTLPTTFTIETWIYPINTAGYPISWASSDNNNCLLLQSTGLTANEWHHIVITWDGTTMSVHDNGKPNYKSVHSYFCGDHTGSLVIAQEQDSVGGAFDWTQSSAVLVDSVAVYSEAFPEAERMLTDKSCLDLTDRRLYAAWSGYTRGMDLIGNNDAEVRCEGFAAGTESTGKCANAGYGMGSVPDGLFDMKYGSHVPPAVGAVGWVFPGGSTKHHFLVDDLTLPPLFTLQAWVYPLNNTASTYFLSYATSDNNNCIVLQASGFSKLREWQHLTITWDGDDTLVFLDGELAPSTVHSKFCGGYTGSLSIGQEQDAVAGSYDANQAAAVVLDTVALYSTAFSLARIKETDESPCIDLSDPDLYALWSGYSRGTDLVGNQDGEVFAAEILSPDQPKTTGVYQVSVLSDFCLYAHVTAKLSRAAYMCSLSTHCDSTSTARLNLTWKLAKLPKTRVRRRRPRGTIPSLGASDGTSSVTQPHTTSWRPSLSQPSSQLNFGCEFVAMSKCMHHLQDVDWRVLILVDGPPCFFFFVQRP